MALLELTDSLKRYWQHKKCNGQDDEDACQSPDGLAACTHCFGMPSREFGECLPPPGPAAYWTRSGRSSPCRCSPTADVTRPGGVAVYQLDEGRERSTGRRHPFWAQSSVLE